VLLATVAACGAATASAHGPRTLGTTASAPRVQSMIVGTGGRVISSARTVAATAGAVQVDRRSCGVDGGTPLAALLALRRAGGPGFALRDYGHCSASPANSGELFVYSLDGETNRGQSGWEYKVDDVSGSTGAADPSGPEGNGRRLRSGERVLWFWCQASGTGCERTLEVSAASSVSAAHALTVTVEGFDNEGRGVPVAGAIVTLGSDFASTAAGGRATLIAPSTRGSYQVSASRSGLVPSFPETIVVR
jgi:hypothetical protein